MTEQQNESLKKWMEVFKEEWKCIHERRKVAFGLECDPTSVAVADSRIATTPDNKTKDHSANNGRETSKTEADVDTRPQNLVGLALSGGGIRSALFNDGILQALSHRGFMRYVDYLASISGGAYIAGHFLSREMPSTADSTSHGSKSFYDSGTAWHLGRDPETGVIDRERLKGVGSYLNRTALFASSYIVFQAPTIALYLGVLGVFATLVALFYRAFDDALFRTVVVDGLGFSFGDELFIALLPCIGMLVLFMSVASMRIAYSLLKLLGWRSTPVEKRLTDLQFVVISLVVFSLISGLVIYLGNSKTKASSSAESFSYLNGFAQPLGIIFAILQILVFLGRDRLFRSEKAESSPWMRFGQQLVSTGLVLLAIIAMIHWMGRENLSGYADHRDPYLLRGEVYDWSLLIPSLPQEIASVAQEDVDSPDGGAPAIQFQPPHEQEVNFKQWALEAIGPPSNVDRLKLLSLMSIKPRAAGEEFDPLSISQESNASFDEDVANARSPIEGQKYAISFAGRWVWLFRSCCIALGGYRHNQTGAVPREGPPHQLASGSLDTLWWQAATYFANQQELVKRINAQLERREFTNAMLLALNPELHLKLPRAKRNEWEEFLKSFAPQLSSGRRQTIVDNLVWHQRTDSASAKPRSKQEILRQVRLNHDLLELASGKAMNPWQDISTLVVQSHDQQSRWHWLITWLGVLCFGLVGTWNLNAQCFLFRYYRWRLKHFFLAQVPRRSGEPKLLCDVNTWTDGRPFPLILGSWMKADRSQGLAMTPKPFIFSPKRVLVEDGNLWTIPTREYVIPGVASDIRLSDAVAISGSAVTPWMTNNLSLAAIMDLFGLRLGQWLPSPESAAALLEHRSRLRTARFMLLVTVVMLGLCWLVSASALLSITILISMIVATQIMTQNGYPYMLWTVGVDLRPKNTATTADQSTSSVKSSATPSLPSRMFVADGGFCDFLGVMELFRRRCELIVVSDAGCNTGESTLKSLADMCEQARSVLGIRFVDMDHYLPIDIGRLERNEERVVPQPYLCMRVLYPKPTDGDDAPREGVLIYAQMGITDTDPIEIQQIKYRFKSFPDEPTTNQFYTDDQVRAYQNLGYYIGTRVCSELERWSIDALQGAARSLGRMDLGRDCQPYFGEIDSGSIKADDASSSQAADRELTTDTQPLFDVMLARILTGYRLACHEELLYRTDDVYGEAIWPQREGAFPGFKASVNAWQVATEAQISSSARKNDKATKRFAVNLWLDTFDTHADVRNAYMRAVLLDVNSTPVEDRSKPVYSHCQALLAGFITCQNPSTEPSPETDLGIPDYGQFWRIEGERGPYAQCLLLAHYTTVAAACQRVHRGAPHAVFQVGGREKLIDLVDNVWQAVRECSSQDKIDSLVHRIIDDVNEMQESVFLGAENSAVVSFAQCLSRALVQDSMIASHGAKATDNWLDFRRDFSKALLDGRRLRAKRAWTNYLAALCRMQEPSAAKDAKSTKRESTSDVQNASIDEEYLEQVCKTVEERDAES